MCGIDMNDWCLGSRLVRNSVFCSMLIPGGSKRGALPLPLLKYNTVRERSTKCIKTAEIRGRKSCETMSPADWAWELCERGRVLYEVVQAGVEELESLLRSGGGHRGRVVTTECAGRLAWLLYSKTRGVTCWRFGRPLYGTFESK